jgi:hypothetical protein
MKNCVEKETYDAPTLVAHGTIEEMTQANTTGPLLDQALPNGVPPLLS